MKIFSAILSAVSAVYTLWYLHFDKPWTNDGAISSIGLAHRALFAVWGALTFAALATAVTLGYRTFHKTKLYLPLLATCGLGMVLTVSCRFEYHRHTEYILHCGGSLAFSVLMGVTVFLLFLLGWKKHMIFKIFSLLTAAIMLTDGVLLCIFKETGLIETLPIFAGYLMLGIVNLRSDTIETARTAATA